MSAGIEPCRPPLGMPPAAWDPETFRSHRPYLSILLRNEIQRQRWKIMAAIMTCVVVTLLVS